MNPGLKVKIDLSGWDSIQNRVRRLGELRVRAGILAEKGGNDRPPGSDWTLIEIAAAHEYGNAHVPERSFIRRTFSLRWREGFADLAGKLARMVIAGKLEPEQAYERLGVKAASEIRNTVTQGDIPPPLAQSTIDAKGSSKPLVDTGRMIGAITYVVEEKPR